jgi:ankyrin repeat protein
MRAATGFTALHYAAATGQHVIADMLVNRFSANMLAVTK